MQFEPSHIECLGRAGFELRHLGANDYAFNHFAMICISSTQGVDSNCKPTWGHGHQFSPKAERISCLVSESLWVAITE